MADSNGYSYWSPDCNLEINFNSIAINSYNINQYEIYDFLTLIQIHKNCKLSKIDKRNIQKLITNINKK